MTGSKTSSRKVKEVLAALKNPPVGGDFVWDGKDEDERPLSQEEMRAGMETARKRVGRPQGSGSKEQVAIRIDRDVLAAFRDAGPGWQTRMNAALKEWLKTHSPG